MKYILTDFSGWVHTIQPTKKEVFERINDKMKNGGWNIRFGTEKQLKQFGFYIVKNN